MRWKINLHCNISIKPNTGFLKGLIKLTNFWQVLLWIKAGKEPVNTSEMEMRITTELSRLER